MSAVIQIPGKPIPAHGFEFPTFIDSTARKTFAACEQKWWYEFIECLAPSTHSIHLHAGGVFARGLEVLRLEHFGNGKTLAEALDMARVAMLVEWGDFEPAFSWSDGQTEPKSLDRLFEALDYYLTVWDPALDPVQPYVRHDGAPAVEFSFAIPIPGCFHPVTGDPILYTGRFDMLGIYNGVMYVVDEKTTKQLGASWPDQWEMRSQFTGYCWAAKEYGYPVGGAIVRGISFLKHGYGSAQHLTYREQWKIDRWLEQLQRNVRRMIDLWYDPSLINLNLDESCASFRGCPFVPLCNSNDPETWKSNFVTRRWNPLTKM